MTIKEDSHSNSLFSGSAGVCNACLNIYGQLPYVSYIAELYCEFQNNQSLDLYFISMCESSSSAIIPKYILEMLNMFDWNNQS